MEYFLSVSFQQLLICYGNFGGKIKRAKMENFHAVLMNCRCCEFERMSALTRKSAAKLHHSLLTTLTVILLKILLNISNEIR